MQNEFENTLQRSKKNTSQKIEDMSQKSKSEQLTPEQKELIKAVQMKDYRNVSSKTLDIQCYEARFVNELLHTTIENKDFEIANFLLQSGADVFSLQVNHFANYGSSENDNEIKRLISTKKENIKRERELYNAVKVKDHESAKELLYESRNHLTKSLKDKLSLEALRNRDTKMKELLSKLGEDVYSTDKVIKQKNLMVQ